MKKITGFLKRSQEFRSKAENEKYFFILDKLHDIASLYHNDLPSTFAIANLPDVPVASVEYVLDNLYPDRKYTCRKLSNNAIYCIR
mgnify:FL=1